MIQSPGLVLALFFNIHFRLDSQVTTSLANFFTPPDAMY